MRRRVRARWEGELEQGEKAGKDKVRGDGGGESRSERGRIRGGNTSEDKVE